MRVASGLHEPVYVTTSGKRRRITKREAVIAQLVNKSATADLRATKMLFDMMKEAEHKAGVAAPPEPQRLSAPDKEVVQLFVERLRRQILAEMAEKNGQTASSIGESHDDI